MAAARKPVYIPPLNNDAFTLVDIILFMLVKFYGRFFSGIIFMPIHITFIFIGWKPQPSLRSLGR